MSERIETFSAKVKRELCRDQLKKHCCCVAEAYGMLLFGNSFTPELIKVVTENPDFTRRIPVLFKKAFDIDEELEIQAGGAKIIFSVRDKKAIERIYETVSLSREMSIAAHLNFGVLEEEHCRAAFIRGAFLAGGSVSDPETGYHLELATTHIQVGRQVQALMVDMDLEPKSTVRKSNYVLYFKNSVRIEDFLTLIGAGVSAMDVMSAKIYKDVRNDMNRRVNCDLANTDKTVDAAQMQIAAIRKIEEAEGLESMGEKLFETARMRLENPEASLTELCSLFDPPVTKSCLNHRLRRIVELAREY